MRLWLVKFLPVESWVVACSTPELADAAISRLTHAFFSTGDYLAYELTGFLPEEFSDELRFDPNDDIARQLIRPLYSTQIIDL